jgi:GNAT superfamily N-acetyltransferase
LHAAAEVRGIRSGERIVAQGALGDYQTAATLAKMVVAEELRGQRWGARLLDGFLAEAERRGMPVGLCATDQGRPLYASRGFEVSGELVILFGSCAESAAPALPRLFDVEEAVRLDREFSKCDRSRMLRARFSEASCAFHIERGGRGFVLAAPQGDHTQIGPVLADSEGGAEQLMLAILAAVDGPVRIDVPSEHARLRRALVALGLREMSVRVEMAWGTARAPWQVPERYALVSQAWG